MKKFFLFAAASLAISSASTGQLSAAMTLNGTLEYTPTLDAIYEATKLKGGVKAVCSSTSVYFVAGDTTAETLSSAIFYTDPYLATAATGTIDKTIYTLGGLFPTQSAYNYFTAQTAKPADGVKYLTSYDVNDAGTVVAKYYVIESLPNGGTRLVDPSGDVCPSQGTYWANLSGFSQGGAIYNSGIISSLVGDFIGNTAIATGINNSFARGGAICNYSTITSLVGDFIGNAATGSSFAEGGAIYNKGTITSLVGDFIGNTATATGSYAYGGAIHNYGSITSIVGDFIGNTATGSHAEGGAIYNNGTATISDSNFTNNTATNYGGAIYNGNGSIAVNIIASEKDVVFSGNTAEGSANDIINNRGTVNLYTSAGKKISFDGGIVSWGGNVAKLNINTENTSGYGVNGTVVFKTGSKTTGNTITLGGGTLQIEKNVTWTDNSLTHTAGTLDLVNGATEETTFSTLNADANAGLKLNIDLAETRIDSITVTTLTSGYALGKVSFFDTAGNEVVDWTSAVGKTFEIGNGLANISNYQFSSSIPTNGNNWRTGIFGNIADGNLSVSYYQSLNAAVSDTTETRTINLIQDFTATADLGELGGTKLTIDGKGTYKISGTDTSDENTHYAGITVGSGKTLLVQNVADWSGFSDTDGGAIYIYNNGVATITDSTFTRNSANRGGAIYIYENGVATISDSNFTENSATDRGGAIRNSGTATITDSTFTNNSAYSGGAIINSGTVTITDSSFTRNSAGGNGGAIYNAIGNAVNIIIIASERDVTFSGNTANGNDNDIYNRGGTVNLYAAEGKTISFDGGIVGYGASAVNLNVESAEAFDDGFGKTGIVVFKSGSINKDNTITLGGGTLQIEKNVTWTNNSLAHTAGTLDLANGAIEETTFSTLNADANAGLKLNIDLTGTRIDSITATTPVSGYALDKISFFDTAGNEVADWTSAAGKTFTIGNGVAETTTARVFIENFAAGTEETNYFKRDLTGTVSSGNLIFATTANSTVQSLNDAVADTTATRSIELKQDISLTADLGTFGGTQLTIDGKETTVGGVEILHTISGNGKVGIGAYSGQKLVVQNVADWSGFTQPLGGVICNYNGTATITDSNFTGNSANVGGAIYNLVQQTVNIIASERDVTFSGNTANGVANDICNTGILNLYTATDKTMSFGGGITCVSTTPIRGALKINVESTEGFDDSFGKSGKVVFESGSITKLQNITLGGGTLQIEYTNYNMWENNVLTLNGGRLEIGGDNEPGRLICDRGSLTLNKNGAICIDIIDKSGYDVIMFSNSAKLEINGGKLVVDLCYDAALGDSFQIVTNFVLPGEISQLDSLTIELANKPASWNSSYSLAASLGGTNNRSLVLTVVPEPSLFGVFAGLGALVLVGTRRRRK